MLWTIGHSTRAIRDFLHILQAHEIRCLVDVRRFPYSRRHPQFNTDALQGSLIGARIQYHALPALGGRRTAKPDSINQGWRNAGFRGYADYMGTDQFWSGVDELMKLAGASPTVIMCAESLPWRCHRSLIADAMISRGWTVHHIMTATKIDRHCLTPFGGCQVHS